MASSLKAQVGMINFALGFDIHKGSYECSGSQNFNCVSTFSTANAALSNSVTGCPGNPSSPDRSRDIRALYGELLVPFHKSFKFQPSQNFLIRGSANTGFRAPTPQQLYLGQSTLALTGTFNDPEKCPADPNQCNRSSQPYRAGGNPTLKPETSQQVGLGAVFAPAKNLQFSADYWQVKLDDRIRSLSPTFMITNYALFKDSFIRTPSGAVDYIQAGWVNAVDSEPRGIEFSLYLPWKVFASVGFKQGNWNSTLSMDYKDGYMDEDMSGYDSTPLPRRKVSSYTTFNLFSTYTVSKSATITAGIINLLDRQPPFTWHNVDGVIGAGWDPRVADPRGRTFQIAARYNFQ